MTTELESYQIQLEQVELALRTDPDDEELLALKEDLLQVIELSEQLEAEEDAKKEEQQQKKATQKVSERDKLIAQYVTFAAKLFLPHKNFK